MDTSTLSYAPAAARSAAAPLARPPAKRSPGFWRAPFDGSTYREIGYTLISLPIAVGGFTYAVTGFSVGVSTATTPVGLPVLAGTLGGARRLGALERRRVRAQLGRETPEPAAPPAVREAGWWARVRARLTDRAGWKALLFQAVMFPWRVASFCVSLTFVATGWALALLPAYSWVFPHYVGWPGYRIYDYTSHGEHHQFYLSSPAEIAGTSLLGLAIVFLTPKLVHALTSVDRAAVRGMLG
jgi:hypothetical protein